MNAFLLLSVLAAAAETALGVAAIVLALRAVRARDRADERVPLLGLVGGRQAVVALVSAPILILFLRSQVDEWSGVMCIQGILRLGSQAHGLAAGLPALLATVLLAKALLLLAIGGAWVLRRIDGATRTAPLARAAAVALAVAGVLSVIDGGALLAWTAIPKAGRPLAAGCCMAMPELGGGPTSDAARTGWTAAFLGSAAVAGALAATLARRAALPSWRSLAWPIAAASGLAVTVTGGRFLQTALAPARLRRPLHECGFCLLDEAPVVWIGVVSALACTAFLGWAWLAAWGAGADGAATAGTTLARVLLLAAVMSATLAAATAVVERWFA